jgi:serine/threonine protein kinase
MLQDRFRLIYRLGRGGMGSVWLAEDQRLLRPVALKELTWGDTPDEIATARKRVEQEARALARVRHPVIVPVYDLLYEDEEPWIVMEYVDGRSLDFLIRERPLDDESAARIGLQVARGLAAVHKAEVVHRDVKPENILRADNGAIYLVDFGIAWIAGGPSLTKVNAIIGSGQYIAPERILESRTVGPPADLWSLGVTLYVAITGRRPFRDINSDIPVLRESPAPIAQRSRLAGLIFRLLDKDPARRADVAEVIRVLQAILRDPAALPPEPDPAPSDLTLPAGPAPNVLQSPAPGHRLDYIGERIAEVRDLIKGVGPETGARMLLGIPERDAALILSELPTTDRAKLLDSIAEIRSTAAAGIFLRLGPELLSGTADWMRADTVAAIFAEFDVVQVKPIVAGMSDRRAGKFVRHLPGPFALALFKELGKQRTADIVIQAPRTAAAEVLGLDPNFAIGVLRLLKEPDRQQIGRLLSGGPGFPQPANP